MPNDKKISMISSDSNNNENKRTFILDDISFSINTRDILFINLFILLFVLYI